MIPVKDVMTRNVITFREDTPIDEVATTLASKHITGAPVIGADGHVSGIVSEVDVFSKSDVLDFFASTRWTCNVCGRWERGLEMPERCYSCSSTDIHLVRGDPGH